MERKYIAFISYRHAPLDSAVAKALHSLIEQFQIPKVLRKNGKRKFGLVFRDQEELPVSSDLSEDICRALDNSEHLIVICSPNTAQSPWVSREIEYFLSRHPRQKVFTVLAAGEPGAVFPYALTRAENPDGSITEVEPLAVDARAESTSAMVRKLRKEAVRLYAAMLGCPYDDLVQRQQRRRRRTIAAAVSAVLAVSLGFSGMLLVKNHQIDLKNQELEEKNEELARQKAEVQLRESELLTQNARDAMMEGDYAAAISYAVAALPRQEDQRPYYAQAESALMEGLNLFGQRQDNHLVLDTVLQQMTAITDFAVGGDGNALVTIDDYGTLTCFDTHTGEILWTNQIPTSHFTSVFDHDWELLLCEDQNSIVGCFGGTLASFDFESGQILWQQSLMLEDDHLFLSPHGKHLMCLARQMDISTGQSSYTLNLLWAETGEIVFEIPLPEELSGAGYLSNTEIGAFSEDGTRFAGSVLQSGNSHTLHYYMADLAAGTVEIIRSEQLSEYWYEQEVVSMAFSGDDLLVVRLSPTGALRGCLEILDPVTGERLLRAEPEGEPKTGDFDTDDPIRAIHTATKTYLYRGKLLYCVDHETGESPWSVQFAEKLLSLQIVQDTFFAYTLENGDYALAWRTDLGLYNSSVFGTMANLGDLAQAELWDGGFIRAQVDGYTIEDITAAGDNRGFAAVIRPGDEQKIIIKRTRLLQGLAGERAAIAAKDKESIYDPVVALGANTLVLGPFNSYQYSEGTENHRLAAFDTETMTHKFDIPVDSILNQEDVYVLPDGSGYVLDDGNGGISLFAADGSETVLSERETVVLSQRENLILQGDVFQSASVRLEDSEDILTVRCGDGSLKFWKNGEEAGTVPLTERVIWALHNGVQFNRILEVGSNGLVVLSAFENEKDLLSDWLAVYDTAADCWTFLEDQGSGDFERLCAVGSARPVFAVADPDGMVWVYDELNAEITKTQFQLQIPLSSVEQMHFAASDRVLMVKTAGKQLLFYDISTGQILLQHQLDTSNLTMVTAFEDAANGRLYVADLAGNQNSENGLCIDTSTWTVLAQIKGMLCFDEESSTLYRYDNGNLIAAVIPGTGELIRIARDLLQ